MLEGVLRYTPPRRPALDLLPLASADDAALATLDAKGYGLALVACSPSGLAGVPAGSAALLERGAQGWRALAVWPYDPPPAGAHWSQVLSPSALCLGAG
jgi:hypothetical protein